MTGIPSKHAYILTEVGLLLEEEHKKRMENVILTVGKHSSDLIIGNTGIESIKFQIQTELSDTFDEFLKAGNNTLLVAKLKFDNQSSFILKLFNISLVEVIMHYISLQEFQTRINNQVYFADFNLNLDVSYLFLYGYYYVNDKVIPYIIQEYNDGIGYTDLRKTIPTFSTETFTILFKNISSQGFIIDPSPMNWIFELNSLIPRNISMTYIDLLYFNDPMLKNEALKLAKILLEQPMD